MKNKLHYYDIVVYVALVILSFFTLTGCQDEPTSEPIAPYGSAELSLSGGVEIYDVIIYQSNDIKRWYNDHKAAISITYDTGNPLTPQDKYVFKTILAHNLTMGIELVSGHFNRHPEFWHYLTEELVPAGITFFGHGHEHINHDSLTYDEAYESARQCLGNMRAWGLNTIAFAYPGGLGIEKETQEAIKNAGFYCGRLSNHKYYFDTYYIDPDDARTNFFMLPAIHMEAYDYSNCAECINTNAEFIPVLDKALEKRAWIIPMYHSIGQSNSYGYYYMGDFEKDVVSIAERDFWVASMNDITKYTLERKNATFSLKYLKNRSNQKIQNILFSLNHSLDPLIFDHPLTVQIELPKSWYDEELVLMQNSEILQFINSDNKHAVINIKPSADEYELLPRERVLQKLKG